jgi:hypothetical protein
VGPKLLPGRGLISALLHPSSIPLRLAVAAERLAVAPAHLALRRLARGGQPIVVGPWVSEVGFELLYWIPFLRWARSSYGLDPARLVVVSRGGTAGWYSGLTERYVDLLDFYSLEQFRDRNEQRVVEQSGIRKHREISELDLEIVKRVRQSIGAETVGLLHPTLMNQFFQSYWQQRAGSWQVERVTDYQLLRPPSARSSQASLPDQYVAVKFYFNNSFPDSAENRLVVQRLVFNLAATSPVVMLNTGLRFDDHLDCDPALADRIQTVEHLLSARDNLEVQSAIVAGAQAFYGTYGGFSYLAPLYGVSSISFYSDPRRFNGRHLALAQRVFGRLGGGSFSALDVRDLDQLGRALGASPAARPPGRAPLATTA